LSTDRRDAPRIIDYGASTYRTDFWQGQGREYEDAVERVAIRAMLPRKGERLVDIGAGFGRLADLYEGYREVILLDYSAPELEDARQHLGDGRYIYVAADIYRMPLATGAVDTAVMVRVLHHIADVPAAMAQLSRILVTGGTLLLEFANKRHLKNIVRFLLRRGASPFGPYPVEFAPLHYDFHPGWVEKRLTEATFHVERRRSVSLFRAGFLKQRVPLSWLIALDGALQRLTAAFTPAPSMFFQAIRQQGTVARPLERAALFRCPDCGHEPLEAASGGLLCAGCGRLWPQVNGVYILK